MDSCFIRLGNGGVRWLGPGGIESSPDDEDLSCWEEVRMGFMVAISSRDDCVAESRGNPGGGLRIALFGVARTKFLLSRPRECERLSPGN